MGPIRPSALLVHLPGGSFSFFLAKDLLSLKQLTNWANFFRELYMNDIRGIITRVLKQGETAKKSSFVLIEYEDPESGGMTEARLSGRIGTSKAGDAFAATGNWKTSEFKGKTQHIFYSGKFRPGFLTTASGSLRYLELNFSDGFGIAKSSLEALVRRHSVDTIRNILENPELLIECSNDPDSVRDLIIITIEKKLLIKQARDLLEDAGFTDESIDQILSAYKEKTYKIITTNPYAILDFNVDFENVDNLGRNMGINPNDKRRINAIIVTAIKAAERSGSSCIKLKDLIASIPASSSVNSEQIKSFLESKPEENEDRGWRSFNFPESGRFFLRERSYRDELSASIGVLRFIDSPDIKNKSEVEETCQRLLAGSGLDEHQREAVAMAVSQKISIITGGPGTGKSTILKNAIEVANTIGNERFCITAPTGMAAKRAEEITGDKGQTLQMLLGMHQDEETGLTVFSKNQTNPIPSGTVVVVDEASMLDNELLAALFQAMPKDSRVIFLGDPFQLPSVGVGRVLADLLEMNIENKSLIPVTKLVNVYRQSKGSAISEMADKINKGIMPDVKSGGHGGVLFNECQSNEITLRIIGVIDKFIKDGIDVEKQLAIICPQAPGLGGTWEINHAMAAKLNPHRQPLPGVNLTSYDDPRMPIPHLGDRVMITKNDHDKDVTNGDTGFISSYEKNEKYINLSNIKVKLDCGREVLFKSNDWRELILSYAMTSHKSQGNQFPIVILPFSDMHLKMAERSLVYTSWTRAKNFVIGVGSEEVMKHYVDTSNSNNRDTVLNHICAAFAKQRGINPKGKYIDRTPIMKNFEKHSDEVNTNHSMATLRRSLLR